MDVAAAVTELPLPRVLRYALATPTAQHQPRVKGGERVRAGDPIAAGLHAAAAGVVERTLDALLVHVDDSGERAPPLTGGDLAERIRQAGVVGMGGAGYPAHRKLLDARARGVHTVIVNAVECEPGVSADRALLAVHLPDVLSGLRALTEYLGGASGVLAVGRPLDAPADVRTVEVTGRYPTGSERQVVAGVLGQEIPKGAYPVDVGAVVFNVATVYAIQRAWLAGEPVTRRIVTLDGENHWVRIGHPVAELPLPAGEPMVGGPVTGWPASADAAVEKTTRAVTVAPATATTACIRCGWCAPACPEGLLPQELFARIEAERWTGLDTLRLEDCVECGACDVACPSRLPLLATFRFAKSEQAAARHRATAAATAKAHYERRNARLAQQAAETRSARSARLTAPREWKR